MEGVNAQLVGHLGGAHIVGVAGPAGVGKSSLIACLIGAYRARDMRVAVVTVDPSGPGAGAVLGDRIRLPRWSTDPDVFIRSMASRGHPGGLAPSTPVVLRVFDACRFDVILVEAASISPDVIAQTDTLLLVVTPDTGDAVQLSKLEGVQAADVVVVNKADREGVGRTVRDLKAMTDNPVITVVATADAGVADLCAVIDAHVPTDPWQQRHLRRVTDELESMALDIVREQMVDAPDLAQRVVAGELDPFVAAQLMTGSF